MGKFLHSQKSFAHGEISPDFFSRSDIAATGNGLSLLENMDVTASGAITRRRGTKKIAAMTMGEILIPFARTDTEGYILVLCHECLHVYNSDGEIQIKMSSPWTSDEIGHVQYARRFDTMIFTHPNHRPQVLRKMPDGGFRLSDFAFHTTSTTDIMLPYIKFDDMRDVKLTLSNNGSNLSARVVADRPIWSPEIVGTYLMMIDRRWSVTEYINPTTIVIRTNSGFTMPTAPISDWREAAFSDYRGWPVSITFHQDRLVFGGSRDWPCGIWMSRTGDHTNFDVGTGLDDEAIFITLLSERMQQIVTVISSDSLQILTTEGEWAISSQPLTPSTLSIKQHTSVGSSRARWLPPQNVEGSTIFIAKSGNESRELVLDNLNEVYTATNLCAFATHMMHDPIDIAYQKTTRRLYIVLGDGTCAVLTKNTPLNILAWARYITDGRYLSVMEMNDEVFTIVRRGDALSLEKFDADETRDAGEFDFTARAAGLPLYGGGHNPTSVRIFDISARVLDTKSLFIDDIRATLPNEIYDAAAPGFSGDVSISQLGTNADTMKPLWKISVPDNLPATILSVTVNGRYAI